jgi:hypothetical protein
MLLAGIGLGVLAHSTVQAFAPTTEEPAVVTSLDSHSYCSGGRGRCRDRVVVYTLRAVTSTGETLDLPGRYWFGSIGLPIRIVRSAAGDQVVVVRSPVGTVDVRTEARAIVMNLVAGLVAGTGLWLGVRRGRRRPLLPAAALATGALIGAAYMFGLVSGAVPPEVAPSAMQGYADPPTSTLDWGRRMDSIVGLGTEVTDRRKSTLTVTGPPQSGPPPGADLALPGFDIVTIPIRFTPGEPTTGLERHMGVLPDIELLGDGVGRSERVYVADWGAAHSSGVLPRVFFRDLAPARSYICFAVASGFTPRYLVVPEAKVAIDLR